jgi:hypothetical protein
MLISNQSDSSAAPDRWGYNRRSFYILHYKRHDHMSRIYRYIKQWNHVITFRLPYIWSCFFTKMFASSLKMETVGSPEMLVTIYQTSRCHNTKDKYISLLACPCRRMCTAIWGTRCVVCCGYLHLISLSSWTHIYCFHGLQNTFVATVTITVLLVLTLSIFLLWRKEWSTKLTWTRTHAWVRNSRIKTFFRALLSEEKNYCIYIYPLFSLDSDIRIGTNWFTLLFAILYCSTII